ncbi:hypothetical protein [Kineosporia sp. A_224]|uniref:hypothetical protein n=1 Tax=Kineosporia sp. A_224 TaxID=1962180 RepID=UPI000B4AD8CE|nr:hypothetical protein [Kineosporia sp. A_224]
MNHALTTFIVITITTLGAWWFMGRPPTDFITLIKVIGVLTTSVLIAQHAPSATADLLKTLISNGPGG